MKSVLYSSLKSYLEKESESFFKTWFLEYGNSHFFVFKQNLTVTNIQFGELLALINTHVENEGVQKNILFQSVTEFENLIKELLETFNLDDIKGDVDSVINTIEECYSEILYNTVVIEPFWGSCAVFLPRNLKIDLSKICSLSGYIHSCGDNIFTRRVYKANKQHFKSNLKHYLDSKNNTEERIPFNLYAHEDFTPFDRSEGKEFFKNGLDDIKFYVEKLYMQSDPLIRVIKELEEDEYFQNRLDIAKPGDYHKNIKGDSPSSIWLIVDKKVSNVHSIQQSSSKEKFFICYNQKFINENPLHLFDENKPGWIDHTTIPHSLMGAMINIALQNFSVDGMGRNIRILDPFIGSGTTLLETIKYDNITFEGSDLSELSSIVTKDNTWFFSLGLSELFKLYFEISQILIHILNDLDEPDELKFIENSIFRLKEKHLASNQTDLIDDIGTHELEKEDSIRKFKRVQAVFNKLLTKTSSGSIIVPDSIKASFLDGLENELDRILFYTLLKAFKRNIYSFERSGKAWNTALKKELNDFRNSIYNLYKLRNRSIYKDVNNKILQYTGNYSSALSINPNAFKSVHDKNEIDDNVQNGMHVLTVLRNSLNANHCYDLIITDPPYGFNTEEDTLTFAKLYSEMIELMINCLDNKGQLIICLPESSYTGRQISYFTQKELIVRQVLNISARLGKHLTYSIDLVPSPFWLYKAPYYWESEKALKRSILHFKFQDD